MHNPSLVLIVDPRPTEAEALLSLLAEAGCPVTGRHVQTEADFLAALADAPALVLVGADCPELPARRVAELLPQAAPPDVPLLPLTADCGRDKPLRLVAEVARLLTRPPLAAALRRRDHALDAVAEAVFLTDATRPGHPILHVNVGFERLSGLAGGEVLDQPAFDLALFRNDPDADVLIRRAVAEQRSLSCELFTSRKDGMPFWAALTLTPLRDAAGRLVHFVGVLADVTAHKKLEKQYQQALKMEAVGRLASGVAHDFNNLLTVINGFSELLLSRTPRGSPQRSLLEQIDQSGRRAVILTRQLLAFSQRGTPQPETIDLNALLANMEKLLRRLIGDNIELVLAPGGQLPPLLADAGQLEQVVMNLAVNARDAMPRGGRLTVETAAVDIDASYAAVRPEVVAGRYVRLTVTDTGCGMADDVRSQLFEPFFTTKEAGKGTGLGLATVYGIVKQAQGFIYVYSEVGHGSTFKVYLPPAPSGAVPPAAPASLVGLVGGTETVLLVEDDTGVRTLVRHALEVSGYHVLAAADGPAALACSQGRRERIHLVLSDVIMPGMNGPELVERLRQQRPGLKVLYMSGYTDETVGQYGLQRGDASFLQKPFTPTALVRRVREVLDASERGLSVAR